MTKRLSLTSEHKPSHRTCIKRFSFYESNNCYLFFSETFFNRPVSILSSAYEEYLPFCFNKKVFLVPVTAFKMNTMLIVVILEVQIIQHQSCWYQNGILNIYNKFNDQTSNSNWNSCLIIISFKYKINPFWFHKNQFT